MINNNICDNRDIFAKELAMQIKQTPSVTYCFWGKNGTGKEYVLHNIEEQLEKDFSCYQIISNCIYKKKGRVSKNNYNFGISFQLGGLLGLSLSVGTSDTTKINYVIATLKKTTRKKNVLISAVNYDCISSEGREFLSILINNHQFIEKKVKKNITVILTSINDYFDEMPDIACIHFNDYSKIDLYNYLQSTLACPQHLLTNRNVDKIYKVCGTNFDLVNSYYKYIIKSDESLSISAIIDKKMHYYITSGRRYDLSREDLKNVLFIAADSIATFTPHMIEFVNNGLEINDVEKSLNCATEEHFLEKHYHESRKETDNYIFISDDEKAYLCKIAVLNHESVVAKYYIYLSTYMEDEYFLRARYLYQYFKQLNKEIFALLILALSKAYMLGDTIALDSIRTFFYDTYINSDLSRKFEDLNCAYAEHYRKNYFASSEILKSVSLTGMSPVAIAEIRRLNFKNGQLGYLFRRDELSTQIQQLKTYIDNGLVLFSSLLFDAKEEKTLEMRIIFDIAPYVLDSQNDVETFRKLYDKSLLLENQIQQTAIKKSYTEYIVNVFNRKAFLFATPAVALVHYEQAEAFFRENNINSELAITLSSKAGINISLKRYKNAKDDSEEALKIIHDNSIQIRQVEKIYNNLHLAEFLEYEERASSLSDINRFAFATIQKLKKLLDEASNGKNHVIITNIASLSLYIGDIAQYEESKKRLEKSLKCNDVSDINDCKVNDFYRYHFAWFEFYRLLAEGNWNKCSVIIQNLSGFYPAIFHDTKKMQARIKAACYLLNNKLIPTAQEYCLHFLEYAQAPQDYFSRGLLLSDLQFTSCD